LFIKFPRAAKPLLADEYRELYYPTLSNIITIVQYVYYHILKIASSITIALCFSSTLIVLLKMINGY